MPTPPLPPRNERIVSGTASQSHGRGPGGGGVQGLRLKETQGRAALNGPFHNKKRAPKRMRGGGLSDCGRGSGAAVRREARMRPPTTCARGRTPTGAPRAGSWPSEHPRPPHPTPPSHRHGITHQVRRVWLCPSLWNGAPLLSRCRARPCQARPHGGEGLRGCVLWLWTGAVFRGQVFPFFFGKDVDLQPPSVTLQPPSVTLQPPSVTLGKYVHTTYDICKP